MRTLAPSIVKTRKLIAGAVLIGLALAVPLYWQLGLFTIQPIAAVPRGLTFVIWRAPGEPFFNSLDRMCEQRAGMVTAQCRGEVVLDVPITRIVWRWPYQNWAYRASVGRETYRHRNDPLDDGICGDS